MPYLAIDDNFADNPKVAGLSDRAFRIHVWVLCYCARHLTDGFISAETLKTSCPTYPPTLPFSRGPVRHLVQANLWHEVEGGFVVNGYLEWNRSASDIKEKRAKDRERKRNSMRNPSGTEDSFRADSRGSAPPRPASKEETPQTPLSGETQKPPRRKRTGYPCGIGACTQTRDTHQQILEHRENVHGIPPPTLNGTEPEDAGPPEAHYEYLHAHDRQGMTVTEDPITTGGNNQTRRRLNSQPDPSRDPRGPRELPRDSWDEL